MGMSSVIMAGGVTRPEPAFASACHGAGRRLSHHQALKQFGCGSLVKELAGRGIIVRSPLCSAIICVADFLPLSGCTCESDLA